ncbi:MAG: hypothetical protein ABIQ02_11195 [Saprospiraceae bacterium]
MKSILKGISESANVFIAICAIVICTSALSGQSMPQINARFANPHFDVNTKRYFLDVELNSGSTKEFLFGMNVRFFYDATMLEFQNFDQFSAGYNLLGEPLSIQANEEAGVQMFNLKAATVFVNGAIQIQDNSNPLLITTENWVKAFRVCFKIPLIYSGDKEFCPSVVWDTKPHADNGGFLTGDDGLIITVLENDPTTPEVSAPSHVIGTFFNWEPNPNNEMPYGKPVSNNCLTIAELVGTHDINDKGFALFQNEPNPFNRSTVIQFVVPSAAHVALKFYDASGKEIDEISGDYKEGRNVINLNRLPWMEEAKVIFYRMETDGFRSNTLKMVLINE